MRALLPLATFLALTLAGCAAAPASHTPTGTAAPAHAIPAALPKDISDTRSVMGGADPVNVGVAVPPTTAPCVYPPNGCIRYAFTVNGTASYDAKLTWSLAASDFDLYLYQGNHLLASSANGIEGNPLAGVPPGTTGEALKGSLEAGDYILVVDPYAVAQDSYTLTVAFSH
jgi:hypothetical protein